MRKDLLLWKEVKLNINIDTTKLINNFRRIQEMGSRSDISSLIKRIEKNQKQNKYC